MPLNEGGVWNTLENWRTAAFIVAGFLFLGNTIHEGLGRYTAIIGEPTFLNFVIYASALVISLVGLLGFYAQVAERVPRLARLSAGVVAVAWGAMLILILWATTSTVLNRPMPPTALLFVLIGAIVLGFVLFGVTSLLARTPSRLVGVLLLTFVAAWVVGLGVGLAAYSGDPPDWIPVFLNGASAVVLLAIGYDLRTGSTSTIQGNPPPDSAAK
jgi:hypothetical protein